MQRRPRQRQGMLMQGCVGNQRQSRSRVQAEVQAQAGHGQGPHKRGQARRGRLQRGAPSKAARASCRAVCGQLLCFRHLGGMES